MAIAGDEHELEEEATMARPQSAFWKPFEDHHQTPKSLSVMRLRPTGRGNSTKHFQRSDNPSCRKWSIINVVREELCSDVPDQIRLCTTKLGLINAATPIWNSDEFPARWSKRPPCVVEIGL
jgi:hypothetical protein